MVIGSRTQGDPFRVRRGRENASSQCPSTKRYSAEVTHAILPGKARTTFNKWVPVPETDTGR
uniref:ORF61c n=1 Tax=Pinus koraiensis TaxID=88728 RepID=A4QMC1_PINKO|nr:ORF61c [Pinus koraiensis]ABP35458.1 ORF61c [Pinus koraiensis]